MSFIKWFLFSSPIGIALALGVAIAPRATVAMPSNVATPDAYESETSPHLLTPSPRVGGRGADLKVPLPMLGEGLKPLAYKKRVRASGLLVEETQLAQSNPPPPPTNPGSSSAGGRRDPSSCPQDTGMAAARPLLTALSPTTKPGLTVAEHPTFLVYVPKTSAKNAEFSLRSRMGQGVYRTMIALPTTPNLISITLPAQAPPLAVGQSYTWAFAIICKPNDRLDDRFVTGMIQRLELDPARLRQIQQASPREQVALYQKADAWYDALTLLLQLKSSQPKDSTISAAWRELLQAGGVDTMIDSNSGNSTP